MLQVSQLYIYPIKSLGGIAVSSVAVTDRGFEYDRRWMLVDENGRFFSQRESSEMALLQVEIKQDGLFVFHKHQPEKNIFISFPPYKNKITGVQIWDVFCNATLVSAAADDWFSSLLKMNCRLVYMNDDTVVAVDERYSINNSLTSFSDGFPILMISEASFDDLNRRAATALPVNRFRPNLVISGCDPYSEDTMAEFMINNLKFYGAKPSARCIVTSIDQASAERGKEPLKTLSTYRSINNKIYFGENVIAESTGKISVGDKIEITKTKTALFNLHT